MLLREYLNKKKIRYQDFAEHLGVTRDHVYNVLAGRRRLSSALAKRVEELTDGIVTRMEALYPEDFQGKVKK